MKCFVLPDEVQPVWNDSFFRVSRYTNFRKSRKTKKPLVYIESETQRVIATVFYYHYICNVITIIIFVFVMFSVCTQKRVVSRVYNAVRTTVMLLTWGEYCAADTIILLKSSHAKWQLFRSQYVVITRIIFYKFASPSPRGGSHLVDHFAAVLRSKNQSDWFES